MHGQTSQRSVLACRTKLHTIKVSHHMTFYPPKTPLRTPFLNYFTCFILTLSTLLSSISSNSLHSPYSSLSSLFPLAYLTARQIAPLVSKWTQRKDNDKRAISQLSFPPSPLAFHIAVMDCSVFGRILFLRTPKSLVKNCSVACHSLTSTGFDFC